MFVLFTIVVWFIVSVVDPLIDQRAKGQRGGVHLSYFLMVTPLMCAVYWGFQLIHPRLGYYVIGALNLFFLTAAVTRCTKNLLKIFRKP